MRWTEEQAKAIEARGSNILLSAAAGSGKTTVLVERVLRLILDEGADVDRMLVVTFTRAAASDMRAKLSKQMTERAAEGSRRCQEQLIRLERASITTLHAFCADFLRSHFEAAGVDPAFRILDDTLQQQMLDEALDEVIEEAYRENSEVLRALDYGRTPEGVRSMAESLCRALEERPDPEKWLADATQCSPNQCDLWLWELMQGAKRALKQARMLMRQAISVENCPSNYEKAILQDLEPVSEMLKMNDYDALYSALSQFKPARAAGGRRKEPVDEGAAEAVKRLRESAKEAIQGIRMLRHPREKALSDMQKQKPQLIFLGELALRVSRRFQEKKDELSGLTYADLERRTLEALRDSETARDMQQRFDYIFLDEYQDTSDIQEAIISCLCRKDNRFMVGDVKQSIYRFRQAEPRLFMGKYERYKKGDGGMLLPLTRNFRSRPMVLRFVNMVFEQVMTGGDAEVLYDELARLNPGLPEGEPGQKVEIHLMDSEAAEGERVDEEISDLKKAEREGLFIARTIRRMMEEDPELHYRDFAILTRAKSSAFTPMLPMLLAENIPAYADGAAGYFDALEVTLTLSMLRLIANRRSDLELIGVLRSPVVGLTVEELARIRIAAKDLTYAEAAERYAWEGGDETSSKLRAFFRQMQSWRLRSGAVSLGELVRGVLDESGFYIYAGALPGGAQRQANLDRLVSTAADFDANVSGSLVRFLGYTEKMRAKGDSDVAHMLGENDDVVRMMTVHKSKGLEFKVVFGALLERGYQGARTSEFGTHRDLGIGMPYLDAALKTRRKTVVQTAIAERTAREDAAEEMRILYVMLTRAQERLILVGGVRGAERAQERWNAMSHAVSSAKSHLDLIMAARAAAEASGEADQCSTVTVHSPSEMSGFKTETEDPRETLSEILRSPDKYSTPEMEESLSWVYPDAVSSQKPLKLTVSGLLREVQGPTQLPEMVQRPEFLSEESAQRMTGTERGTAYHRAMQILDFRRLDGLDGRPLADAIRGQLDEFAAQRRLSAVQREAVRPSKLAEFLSGEVGVRLRRAETVHREWPFNVMLRVREALTEEKAERFADEEIMVQGTIDCCFMEDGQWVLLDYKTDRSRDIEALRERYGRQIQMYALALERITGIPVKQKLLCFLASDCVAEV